MKKKIITLTISIIILINIILIANISADSGYDELDQYQDIPEGTSAPLIEYNLQELVQSFIPTKEILTRVEILCNYRPSQNGPPANLKLSIIKNLDEQPLTCISLDHKQIPKKDDGPDWVEFDVPNIKVTPGETYYIYCKEEFNPVEHAGSYEWIYNKNDPYKNGSAWFHIYERMLETWVWYYGEIYDFCFRTYGCNNYPPEKPSIIGPSKGKTGEQQDYIIVSTDPVGDDISYCINWGDGTEEVCIGPFLSGEEQTVSHTWSEDGDYEVKLKVQDVFGAESEYTTFQVSMPKQKQFRLFLYELLFEWIHNFINLQF
ncbi:MAG: hypothetical protein DRN27_07675 [Thermoplasmata archaeon]|nr:MAG: hypothetical protein DRN27_07675 [Thermoplasmata archaeon]